MHLSARFTVTIWCVRIDGECLTACERWLRFCRKSGLCDCRKTPGASNDSQPQPAPTDDYATIVSRDVRSLYDTIGTERSYEGLQPYERGYDRLHSAEDHASKQPGIELYNTQISGGVYQTNILQQPGMGNLGYTTLNQERGERGYEQLQDPYRQRYEHLRSRDGDASRYTGLQRTEPEEIGYGHLQRSSGTNPQMMPNSSPPYQALNIRSGGGNIWTGFL